MGVTRRSLVLAEVAGALTGCARSTQVTAGEAFTVSLTAGLPVVDFAATTISGTSFDLASYRGRPVAIPVWATWCDGCRADLTALRVVSSSRYPRVPFIGLVEASSHQRAAALIGAAGIDYPNVADDHGQLLAALGGAQAVPVVYLLDTEHRPVATVYGPVTAAYLHQQLAGHLGH